MAGGEDRAVHDQCKVAPSSADGPLPTALDLAWAQLRGNPHIVLSWADQEMRGGHVSLQGRRARRPGPDREAAPRPGPTRYRPNTPMPVVPPFVGLVSSTGRCIEKLLILRRSWF